MPVVTHVIVHVAAHILMTLQCPRPKTPFLMRMRLGVFKVKALAVMWVVDDSLPVIVLLLAVGCWSASLDPSLTNQRWPAAFCMSSNEASN